MILFRNSRLCFMWDPLLQDISNFQTKCSIFVEPPTNIIVGAGLWHLATKMNFSDIESVLISVRKQFEGVLFDSKNVVFQLQTKSLFYDHGIYKDEDIGRLNDLIRKVLKDSPTIQMFDSHLKIFDIYSKMCHDYFPRENQFDDSSFWSCNDPNHSPFFLTNHFASLILNHFFIQNTA